MPNYLQSTRLQKLMVKIGYKGTVIEFAEWLQKVIPFIPDTYKCMRGESARDEMRNFYLLNVDKGDDTNLRLREFGTFCVWSMYNYEHRDRSGK